MWTAFDGQTLFTPNISCLFTFQSSKMITWKCICTFFGKNKVFFFYAKKAPPFLCNLSPEKSHKTGLSKEIEPFLSIQEYVKASVDDTF